MKDLNEKLIKIQTELKTKKSRKNNFGNFLYCPNCVKCPKF